MTTWPAASIPVFPAGYAPQQSDFTTWIQDTLGFLTDGVVFRGRQTSTQSLTSGVNTVLALQAIDEDPYSGWHPIGSGDVPQYAWLAPYTGLYRISVTCGFAAADNWCMPGFVITGTQVIIGELGSNIDLPGGGSASAMIPMTGGSDWVQATMFTAVTQNTVITAGSEPSVEITLVSQ